MAVLWALWERFDIRFSFLHLPRLLMFSYRCLSGHDINDQSRGIWVKRTLTGRWQAGGRQAFIFLWLRERKEFISESSLEASSVWSRGVNSAPITYNMTLSNRCCFQEQLRNFFPITISVCHKQTCVSSTATSMPMSFQEGAQIPWMLFVLAPFPHSSIQSQSSLHCVGTERAVLVLWPC